MLINIGKKYHHILAEIYRKSGAEIIFDEWFPTKNELDERRREIESDYDTEMPNIVEVRILEEEVTLQEMFNRLTVNEIMELDEEIRDLIDRNTHR
ncbi:hypothetical protein L1999_09365 [Neobacillus drentensis]|uniref:hypothetical protein n=1 Tax=Neobacillus drentensis TaxID=220684 RepID=UPI001F287888|nr:hypothetical protein [Neobacillus drentensis]ULT58713.1 hypothetical protein L1999_09365 [Neobacillus drentensis]